MDTMIGVCVCLWLAAFCSPLGNEIGIINYHDLIESLLRQEKIQVASNVSQGILDNAVLFIVLPLSSLQRARFSVFWLFDADSNGCRG